MKRPSTSSTRVDEGGASSSEYGLLISLIALVILAGVMAFGVGVKGLYDRSCDDFLTATSGRTC